MKAATPFLMAAALKLAACSAPDATDDVAADAAAAATAGDSAMADRPGAGTGTPAPESGGRALTLEGLGDLVIGKPVPAGSSFAERGAQIDGNCRTVSSPDYPGVYAITERGEVRRITLSERSNVRLVEGIGVGATTADVLREFPGLRATPHKYVAAPAKYLTQRGDDPRLRFEVGENGRVSLIHAGLMPQLGYVEGCA